MPAARHTDLSITSEPSLLQSGRAVEFAIGVPNERVGHKLIFLSKHERVDSEAIFVYDAIDSVASMILSQLNNLTISFVNVKPAVSRCQWC
jgi:predicted carbohydrate-binding protein with CBM5 and CBM33 domain